MKVERVEKVCPTCGRVFTVLPCHAHRVYCSRPCFLTRPLLSLAERFWAKVDKGAGCWTWKGYQTKDGYGQLGVGDNIAYAHRVAWELTHGPIPVGLVICHHCDNPSCVNPAHLFLGTYTDNLRDCMAKGRFRNAGTMRLQLGERNGNRKLTTQAVLEIRARCVDRASIAALARQYGVAECTIRRVASREAWAHVH